MGVSGATLADMLTLYNARIQGQGFVGASVIGGVNDILGGSTGAAALIAYQALVAALVADGLKVLACTMSPCAGFGAWDATKQTHLMTLRTGILALSDPLVTVLDLYTPMGQSGSPTLLDGGGLDGLHWLQSNIEVAWPLMSPAMGAF